MTIDLYILTFSALTVIATIWMGFWSARKSKTASDFFVAGRSVSVGWNASAISGEYLSAASFMGIAGMVMSSGYDALWYPVCYACGYLFLLLFIAGPLRRFGAYTIPDFAEGRFDSPVFRKIAVVFVLFIGFFYTMPQMKGAGTTLAYIFPGLPYWAGVVLVGAVITLNVALGGMKGITLVQAFQYWAKMFAISLPIFVLMAVYGHYGKQVGLNHPSALQGLSFIQFSNAPVATAFQRNPNESILISLAAQEIAPKILTFPAGMTIRVGAGFEVAGTVECNGKTHSFKLGTNASTVFDGMRRVAPAFRDLVDGFGWIAPEKRGTAVPVQFSAEHLFDRIEFPARRGLGESLTTLGVSMGMSRPRTSLSPGPTVQMRTLLDVCLQNRSQNNRVILYFAAELYEKTAPAPTNRVLTLESLSDFFVTNGVAVVWAAEDVVKVFSAASSNVFMPVPVPEAASSVARAPLPDKAPADSTWLNPFGPLTTKAAKNAAAAIGKRVTTDSAQFKAHFEEFTLNLKMTSRTEDAAKVWQSERDVGVNAKESGLAALDEARGFIASGMRTMNFLQAMGSYNAVTQRPVFWLRDLTNSWHSEQRPFPGFKLRLPKDDYVALLETFLKTNGVGVVRAKEGAIVVHAQNADELRRAYAEKGLAGVVNPAQVPAIALRAGLSPDQRMTVNLDSPIVTQALGVYAELTGRQLLPNTNSLAERMDDLLGGKLSQLKIISRAPSPDNGVREHGDGAFTVAEVKAAIEAQLRTNGIVLVAVGHKGFAAQRAPGILPGPGAGQTTAADYSTASTRQDAGGTLAADAQKAWLDKHEKPLALLYTYSLIIAIVCGTAGLPHILVRFYTNPDGTAAKKTTMWVMILIGVFYIFPPVFGALGRNLLPELYSGVGAKGTDKIVLELPRILNAKYPPLGSILSGITCAGAFAAFMSTFSGLLVSMTGALAHDVYGRILKPKSTPEERLRMFKIGAVIIGGVSILLGMQVEQLQINFMVGQAFAIAAASYFPLLFMAVWWRGLTMKGAATGMLTGGLLALAGISLTSFSDLAAAPNVAKVFLPFAALNPFWAAHPLIRILCEQPAIWAVPLAIALMVIVSKLTAREVPSDSRMKMLVLHAPEQLGLKQEYIQEHQSH